MSETFVAFICLLFITTAQFFVIDSHLDRLEKKINELKVEQDPTPQN